MRLVQVRVQNFRCHRTDTALDIGNLTAIVGKNDSGKSSLLEALQIFFDESYKPESADASVSGDKENCRIICEFDDLPESLVIDTEHKTTLQDEYLLNDAGRLEVHKVYDCSLKTPKAKTLAFAKHPSDKGYSDLLTLTNAALKKRARELNADTSNADLTINSEIRRAIWASATDLSMTTREIEIGDIASQVAKHMPLFQLFKSDRPSTDQDAEAQDPMKAAVKEALKAKQAELDALSKHVENEVRAIAEKTVEKIREMDATLAQQLHPQFKSPAWDSVFKISLTGDEDIPVNKRGSGVRRLILINFFRAKAEQMLAEKEACGIIYAIEEPETSQHPNSQRMLMRALQELAEVPGCQVIITTHTPTLARLLPVDSLRYIECDQDGNRSVRQGVEQAAQLVASALGVLPDHDVRLFIGLEGVNDISFVQTISRTLSKAGEDIPDLFEMEQNGTIVFIPLGGETLLRWVGRLKSLNRPEFHLYDREEAPPKQPKYQRAVDQINKQAGCKAYSTTKLTIENYLHPKAIKAARPAVEVTFAEYDDVPCLVAKCLHDASEALDKWDSIADKKCRKDKVARAKKWLNSEAAAAMTPAMLTEVDPTDELRNWLKEIKVMAETAV